MLLLTVSKVAEAAAEAEEAAVLVEVAPPVHLHLLDHPDPRLVRGGLQGAAPPAAVVPGVRSNSPRSAPCRHQLIAVIVLDPLLGPHTAEGNTMAVVLHRLTEQAGDHLAVSFLSP